MAHTISFQYMEPNDARPSAGYEITDAELPLPQGCHVPRIGEFVQLVRGNGSKSYVVLAVHTRLIMLNSDSVGWHTYITVGPTSQVADSRLLEIHE